MATSGVHAFGQADPLLQGFGDFFVILSIGGRLIDTLAIEECDAAPAIDQRLKVRCFAARRGALTLRANFASVPEEFIENLQLFLVKTFAQLRFIATCADLLVAIQQFFDLERIVGHELSRRIDRGQTATDDPGRQAYLQIRQRRHLRGTGQLQCHQKVRRFADTANQIVLELDDRRLAGAGRDRNVIEAELPSVLDRQSPAESHAAIAAEAAPAREKEVDDLQEILVPADRDAVLGDAAEPGERPLVELLVERCEVLDRLRRVLAVADEARPAAARSSARRSPTTPKPSFNR